MEVSEDNCEKIQNAWETVDFCLSKSVPTLNLD